MKLETGNWKLEKGAMRRQDPQRLDQENLAAVFFENIALFVLLICLLLFTMPGCATTPKTAVTTGSDNATVTAAADSGLSAEELLQYVNLAEQETVAALQLYESTQDATVLEKAAWWLKYASGVAEKIDALSATGS